MFTRFLVYNPDNDTAQYYALGSHEEVKQRIIALVNKNSNLRFYRIEVQSGGDTIVLHRQRQQAGSVVTSSVISDLELEDVP